MDSGDEKIDRRTYTAPQLMHTFLYARGTAGEEVRTGATSRSKPLEKKRRCEHRSVSRHRASPHAVMDVSVGLSYVAKGFRIRQVGCHIHIIGW